MLLKIKDIKSMDYIKVKRTKKASHPAGLAWEIATSPIIMHGRSTAQPHKEILPPNIFTSPSFLPCQNVALLSLPVALSSLIYVNFVSIL